MRILSAIVLSLATVAVAGCRTNAIFSPRADTVGGEPVAARAAATHSSAGVHDGRNFVALLSGEDAGAITRARGLARFHLSHEGDELGYELIVANIENVRMAHIHIAPSGTDGPIGVWLYPDAPPAVPIAGRFNGRLAEGTIEDANLVGPLAGMTVADLVEKIRAGMAYVNVHTDQYPAGEIRGQIDIP